MSAHTRARRALTSLVATAAIAAGLLTPVAAQTAARCVGVDVAGSWATIRTPAVATAHASGPGGIFVTDGETLYRSDDGGCSWRALLTLPGTPSAQFPFVTERITAIATPTERDVYLALTGPHVVASRDAGRTWATVDSGLAGRADRAEIAVAPSDPRVVYLLTRTTASDEPLNGALPSSSGTTATVTTLFVSRDGARTWTYAGGVPPSSAQGPRGQGISRGMGPGSIWELAVSPDDPQRLWTAGTEGVFTSADGGDTWTGEVTKSDLVKGIDVRAIDAPGPGASPAVVAVDSASGGVYSSTDSAGASSWTRRVFPGFKTIASVYAITEPVSLAHSEDGTILGTSPKGVFRLDPEGWSDVSPVGLGSGAAALTDVTAAPETAATFYARPTAVGTSLYRYRAVQSNEPEGPDQEGTGRSSESALEQLSQGIGPLKPPRPAALTPRAATVRLAHGESRTRTFELTLPPHPTPVDVFFLLDTTSSMNGVVRSLARSVASIVTELRADGIDVWPGLGQFRTYPYPGEEDSNFPYRRDVPISQPGRRLARALLSIEGDGQSGANLTALLHSVSGAPLDLLPPGVSNGDLPSGSDAGFRAESLRVIVHAADSPFGTVERGDPDGNKYPPGTWPGPGFDEVIAALNAAGVRQVGGAVGFVPGFRPERTPNALEDLERVARATGTFATRGGVDCDGDRTPDIPTGDPLVCPIPGDKGELLRPAIVSLIRGLRDVAPVSLVDATSSGATEIDPAVYPEVDVRSLQRLRFRVTFTCDLGDPRVSAIELHALLRGELVARAGGQLVCAGRGAPLAMVPPPPSIDRNLGAPLPPPQVPPPPPPPANAAPAQAPAPQPQTQPNPNPNPHSQPHPVAVAQRQAQPQMAFVHAVQQVREQAGMQYAMSDLHGQRGPGAGIRFVVATTGLSLLLLYAYGTATVTALRRSSPR